MLISTKKGSKFGHPEFVLEVQDGVVPESHVKQFVSGLEEIVADGSIFKPGETLQVGWMICQVQKHDDRRLTLWEPDMKSFPVRFVPGLSESLRQMMLQLFYLDSYSIPREESDIPTIQQSAIVCNRLEKSSSLLLSRESSYDANDSGWFFGCGDEDHDHNDANELIRESLYAAFLKRKEIQAWITFPRSLLIHVGADSEPAVFRDGQRQAVAPGTFIDAALKRMQE